MASGICTIEIFSVIVRDRPGEAFDLLDQLAQNGINLISFSSLPIGPESTQLSFAGPDPAQLRAVAERLGIQLLGPQHGFLVRGEDELGALARYHDRLARAGVNVYGSSGVTDGKGGYGYSIMVREEDHALARQALGV